MKLEEEFAEQLQKIEATIVKVYREYPSLVDSEVDRAVEHCVRNYNSQLRGRSSPEHKLKELDLLTFNEIMNSAGELIQENSISPEELIKCLKRIRKSIKTWTNQGGIQGYLQFVSQYL